MVRNRAIRIFIASITSALLVVSCTTKKEAPAPRTVEQTVPSMPPSMPPSTPSQVPPVKEEKRVKANVYLEQEQVGGMTESEITRKIQSKAASINKESISATVDPKTWAASGAPKGGRKLNIEATVKAVMDAKEGGKINLKVEDTKPGLTAQEIKANIVEIGSFTTQILDKDPERVNNIRLASEKIDYKKVGPGEVFSFNETVGPRSEAKGYEEAPIIKVTPDGPKKAEDVGGGICQISTTIYNAAAKAELEIIERNMHSKDVGYVPKGQDATVSYGTVDFKFKNTKSNTIMLRLQMDKNNSLTVKIFENRNK